MNRSRCRFARAVLAASLSTLLVAHSPLAAQPGVLLQGYYELKGPEGAVGVPTQADGPSAATPRPTSGGTTWPSRRRRCARPGSPPSGFPPPGKGRAGPPPSASTSSTTTTWGRRIRKGPYPPVTAPASSSSGAWRSCGPTASTSTSTSSRTSATGAKAPAGSRSATPTPSARSATAGSRRIPATSTVSHQEKANAPDAQKRARMRARGPRRPGP